MKTRPHMNENLLEQIELGVAALDSVAVRGAVAEAIAAGATPRELRSALLRGLKPGLNGTATGNVPLPRFLLCLDIVREGLSIIPPADETETAARPPLVIGVVEGDPHEMGKNIVSSVYAASGFDVLDLGRDVSPEKFLCAIESHNASVLALSAMMSTTMAHMPEIIGLIRQRFPSVVVMAGGAPLTASLARKFGADGYAESAVTLLDETRAAMERVRAGGTR